MKAAREGHIGVVTRLLHHGANIKIMNKASLCKSLEFKFLSHSSLIHFEFPCYTYKLCT